MTLQTHPQTREMVFELEHFFRSHIFKTTRIWTVFSCGHFPSNWADRLIRSRFSTHVCRAHRERSRNFQKIWKSLKGGTNVETIETSWNNLKTVGQLEKGTLFLFVVCVCFVSFYFFSILQPFSTFFTLFQVFSTVSNFFKIPVGWKRSRPGNITSVGPPRLCNYQSQATLVTGPPDSISTPGPINKL